MSDIPEYSNMGLMHELLEQAQNMQKRGQHICYLYPIDSYYRRKGWELVSNIIFTN